MSYTLAWIEAHQTPDAELREKLLDTLVLLHEEREAHEEAREEWDEHLEHVTDEKDAELKREREAWKEEREKLMARAIPETIIREHHGAPKREGNLILIDFRPDARKSAPELYAEAAKIDEDPASMDRAEALYRLALEMDPAFAIARVNLGTVLFRKRRIEEAKREYDRAIKDQPTCPEAHYNLGYLAQDRGELPTARLLFLEAIRLDPSFADAHFNLAMALEQSGDAHTARTHWAKYIELEPKGPWTEIARGHLARSAPPAPAPKRTRRSKKGGA